MSCRIFTRLATQKPKATPAPVERKPLPYLGWQSAVRCSNH